MVNSRRPTVSKLKTEKQGAGLPPHGADSRFKIQDSFSHLTQSYATGFCSGVGHPYTGNVGMGGYYSREQKIRVNSSTGRNILAVDDSVYVQGSNHTVQEVATVQADSQTSVVNAALNGRALGVNRINPPRPQQQLGPQANRVPVQAAAKMGSWFSTEVTSEKHVKVYTPEGKIVYQDDDTKTFKAHSAEAAQDMMVKTADSNVELMKASLNGLSKIQRSAAITNNGPRQAVAN